MRLRNDIVRLALAVVLPALILHHPGFCMDDVPGIVNVVEQPKVDTANQNAFPYYYDAGMPSDNDLVQFGDSVTTVSQSIALSPSPSGPVDLSGAQGAFPDYYSDALLQQSKDALETEISRSRAAYNLIKSYCQSDELDEAWEIYATMPAFADNTLINDYRAEAASLLILNLCRDGELPRAREIYNNLPLDISGEEAMRAKARAIINLTTHYVKHELYNDAYVIIMDIADIPDRDALNNEIFKLMTRMIPYLDNAGETNKAYAVYQLLLDQVRDPETARCFADNFPAIPRYLLLYVIKSSSEEERDKRVQFLQHIFDSLTPLESYPETAPLRVNMAGYLVDFYTEAGELDKARKYYDVMHGAGKKVLPNN